MRAPSIRFLYLYEFIFMLNIVDKFNKPSENDILLHKTFAFRQ